MKKINQYEIIVKEVKNSIKNRVERNDKLMELLSQNSASVDLLDKVSDAEYFKNSSEMLDEAFANRNEPHFVSQLKKRDKRKNTIKLIKILTSTSVAAAVLFISFNIFYKDKSELQNNITENTHGLLNNQYYGATVKVGDNESIKINGVSSVKVGDEGSILCSEEKTNKLLKEKEISKIQQLEIKSPFDDIFTITIGDGSIIWLNKNSVVRFPSQFSDDIRNVEILSGEAFFEVTKDANRPFIVKINEQQAVEVLGTKFNVMKGHNGLIQTALIEGAVKVVNGDKSNFLKPNQLATIPNRNSEMVITDVDANDFISWKSETILFNEQPLCNIINRTAAIYGYSAIYENDTIKNMPMSMFIQRDVTVVALAEALSLTGLVRVRIENNNIIINKVK